MCPSGLQQCYHYQMHFYPKEHLHLNIYIVHLHIIYELISYQIAFVPQHSFTAGAQGDRRGGNTG